ncbi:S8 family serine peptidase [Nakamurella flavida]|uniref:S8 family serine peptidase n=1 Tax=Nakamurella flavida TaxID=363630 RepID=A0A939C2C8_9ACTN|nr:S8 family serine peptidase [Nakamurella flavida]MBM9476430.1 S8 family serine peptidase [Nakamurella flavida]MDP9779469.1 subtilisin family serine protease [Nakamurella flavida]
MISDDTTPTGSQGTSATGRWVLVFADGVDTPEQMTSAMQAVRGPMTPATGTREYGDTALQMSDAQGDPAVLFTDLGVAVVTAGPGELAALRELAAGDDRVESIEPELIFHVLDGSPAAPDVPGVPGPSLDYVRGYRDGVSDVYDRLAGSVSARAEAAGPFTDTDSLTWGLQAVLAPTSPATGAGIKVAVLDTGFDLAHPDFVGRTVTAKSFVAGEDAQDAHGHGTHCVGTSCGPAAPDGVRRYGVAPDAEIFVGKVLGNSGSGTDTNILAGINWAVAQGCAVISMSLGADLDEVVQRYETVGRRALQAGSLIVAAAGNNASRSSGDVGFVGVPANSPSIMAVAAVDGALAVADFSARSSGVDGGEVDIAGPGVDVFSSWLMPERYNTISGTSMATPHVSGVAALHAQASGLRGKELWTTLTGSALGLTAPATDVGSGLVQAPQ